MGILISLDESTVSTGYAIFKNKELIDYGVITQKSKNVLERVNNIMNEIDNLIQKYKPNDMVIENIQITFVSTKVFVDSNSTDVGKKSSSDSPLILNSRTPVLCSSDTSPISHSKKLSLGYYKIIHKY